MSFVLGLASFLLAIAGIFIFVGIFYPTKWHRKVKYKKVDLGLRKWNIILFIVVWIIAGIGSAFSGPTQDDLDAANRENKEIKQKLNQSVNELGAANNQISQLKDTLAKTEKEKQDIEKKLQDCNTEKKKLEDSAKTEAEKNKITNVAKASSNTTTTSSSSKPAYKGTSVNCSDFSTSSEATRYMNAYGVYKLDRDRDGIACESLP